MFTRLCAEIASGKTLTSLVKLEEWPTMYEVMYWLRQCDAGVPKYKGITIEYARARETQAHVFAEETVDISNESGIDVKLNATTGQFTIDGEAVARSRLKVDARKWYASHAIPKKYGEKYLVGEDKENPLPKSEAAGLVDVIKDVIVDLNKKLEEKY